MLARKSPSIVRTVLTVAFSLLTFASVKCDEVTDRLPQSTAFWLRLNRVDQWKQIELSSSLQRFLQHDAFAPVRKSVSEIEGDGRLVDQLGLEWSEITDATHGNVVVAAIPLKDERFTTLIALETSSPEQAALLQQAAHDRFTRRGLQPRTGSMEQLRVAIYSLSSNEQQRCLTCFGRWLLIADETAVFARFATQDQRHPGLSDYAAYQRIQSSINTATERGVAMDWYVDPWRFGRDHVSYKVGFSAIRGAGGRFVFGVGNNLFSYQTSVVLGGPLEKAARMLAFKKSSSPDLPAWYSDKAKAIQVTHLDYATLLQGYAVWFDETHGEGDEGLFETVLEDIRLEPEGPRVDIRKEIVANLNGPLVAVDLGLTHDTTPLFAIKIKDQQTVAQAISKLFEGDPDVRPVRVSDTVAWRYGDLTRGGKRTVLGPNLSDVTLCVAHNHLFVTRHMSALETVLKQASSPQDSSESFNRIFDFSNGKGIQAPFNYGVSKEMGSFAAIYERIRSDELEKPDATATSLFQTWLLKVWRFTESSPMLSALVKTRNQLPEANQIRHMIEGGVHAGKMEPHGWSLYGRVQLHD